MGAFLRKYGTGTGADIYVPIIKRGVTDFALGADWTPAAGDVKVSKDGGSAANIGTLPTAVTMGNTAMWKFVLSDAELQCKYLAITVADSATKAVEDQMVPVETYGHASAMYQADLSAANLPANVIQAAGVAWGSGAITAVAFAAGAIDANAIATDAFGALELAAGASSEIATAVRSELTTELGRIDVAVSSRQPTIWANAGSTVNLSGTTVGTVTAFSAAAIQSIWDALTAALTTVGSIGKFLVTTLTGNSLGTGARTVTPTVQTSGAVAIQGAKIRFTKGAESYVGTTNGSGQVTFNLDDGTWEVSITAPGYSFDGDSLLVNGTETPTYTMTTNSPTVPAAPNLSTGTLLCLGTDGLPEAGVIISFRMIAGPGDAGYSLDSEVFTAESDGDGEIEAPFIQDAQYAARRGDVGREVNFTVPVSASFTLPEHLGAP